MSTPHLCKTKTMTSINCLTLADKLFKSFLVILVYITSAVHSNPPCGLYGAPPCQFLPAPPGQTPSCARPGRTYCEHVDNYPTYLIKHLVHKWGYEAKNIIVDESWEEFESLNFPGHDITSFYDPALIFGPQQQYAPNNFNGYKYDGPNGVKTSASSGTYSSSASSSVASSSSSNYPEPIFIPKPHNSDAANFLIYTSTGQQQAINKNKYASIGPSAKVTNYSPGIWLKRFVRDLSNHKDRPQTDQLEGSSIKNVTISASTRDVSMNLDLLDIVGVNKEKHSHRVKRQSAGRSTLCQTSSQFVMPQAALNSKGNWMFVVNEQNTARQLVKAELCVSTTCANLCQLPNGYTSRCEQKYVQKRLIALQGNGQNLYTDSFWFPSCCVCTIASS